MSTIKLPKKFISKYPHKFAQGKQRYLSGRRILPAPITGKETLPELINRAFLAYNAARLQEGCRLFVEKMLARGDVTVGMSLAGALTPAGLGSAAVVPLIKAGFVDWIVATGANLYHDMHHAMNLPLWKGSAAVGDTELRRLGVVRIYDIFFDYSVLLDTDAFFRRMITGDEFQRTMSTAEFHWLAGKYIAERQKALGQRGKSLLATCYEYDVPVYTSSPGDSSIGMNVAAAALQGYSLQFDVNADVNETASIVLAAKRGGGRSAITIFGGGSPKNFMLQTEPQLQDSFRVLEAGHDYFLQVTDARPDTGGLSGATPHEAVSWGKVDPDALPDAVVCYADTTIVLPLLTHYALSRHQPRQLRRLYQQRAETMQLLHEEARRNLAVKS